MAKHSKGRFDRATGLSIMSWEEICQRRASNVGITSIHEVDSGVRKGLSPLLKQALLELKERRFIPHPFSSIDLMWRGLDLPAMKPSKYGSWRLTNCIAGWCPGIPTISGLRLATDGIICVVVGADGKVFFPHVSNFEPLEQLKLPEYVSKGRKRLERLFDEVS